MKKCILNRPQYGFFFILVFPKIFFKKKLRGKKTPFPNVDCLFGLWKNPLLDTQKIPLLVLYALHR